ncbi:hypothetical protein [Kitasatospora sp. NPDC057223]|uniref:hypothetical protein n=1 Tax=Kitasatospora sp. NPDC057223 TaxID=3346055 RepID=UPI00364379EB
MITSRRPERLSTSRTVIAVAVATTAGAVSLAVAPLAQAAPGDNGDIKVHESTTAVTDPRDEPQVCRFYLDAFNFDTLQLVSWTIEQQPPTGTQQVAAGNLVLTDGTGRTADMTLPDGHYRVNWTFVGETGSAKHKVFMVDCRPGASPSPSPGASASPSPVGGPGGGPSTLGIPSTSPRPSGSHSPGGPPAGGGPHGGVGTGGGGTSQGLNPTEVGAGAALLAVVAGFGIRAARRRAARNAAA